MNEWSPLVFGPYCWNRGTWRGRVIFQQLVFGKTYGREWRRVWWRLYRCVIEAEPRFTITPEGRAIAAAYKKRQEEE